MTEIDTPRAWRTVLDHVETDLLDGRLRPGDRLPGERELAARLGVGRSSVREALRVLEVMGLVRTATGSGPSSGAIIVARPGGGMSTLLRLQTAAQAFRIDDVVSTRVVLETAVVGTLAGGEHDLAAAREVLDAMGDEHLAPADFLALDARFHLALAEASGNAVLVAVMAGLRTAIEAYVQQGARAIDDWPATAARLRAEHGQIVAAVEAGDVARAERCVRHHIDGYFQQIRR
ncbi:FCD domain-containing protein [Nocardioides zeae]|uniref:FCD domain-containing protein n=1 Tax=Nocardioides imazamoxiresistens TaxID=3231893 RepID=A0ABU3PW41_9ACTN|nr:FCD domain-containing protein [Nocardioides zeae]MDT9593416.1 FCD domain-containing protein [Nocardioides zeae]